MSKYCIYRNPYITLRNEITYIQYQYSKTKTKETTKKLFPYNKQELIIKIKE